MPFDRRVLTDIHVPTGQCVVGRARRDGARRDHALADGDARARSAASSKCSGDIDEPGVDTQIIIRKFGIPDAHSEESIEEARRLGGAVKERDIRGRTDFRPVTTVTIDGEHARDFDDAITIERLPNGNYWLGVHIADVSHYVKEGSALDEEAYERGTSVYFPERAVHMFPSELATGLCSLNPHVDRLVQSCLMEVDRRGNVVRYEMHDGVINSDARMTYTAVNAILTDRDPATIAQYAALVPMFELMHELFEILQRAPAPARRRSTSTCRRPRSCCRSSARSRRSSPSERNVAHRLIEEFMLLANETVATHLVEHDAPALHRVHEAPDVKKVEDFEAFITHARLQPGRARPRAAAEALPEADRSDARHAGGAADRGADAAHDAEGALRRRAASGTSAWRRSTTRTSRRRSAAIRTSSSTGCCASRGRARCPTRGARSSTRSCRRSARHTSEMERRADDAERELLQWKKVRFMADKVGDEYDGYITGVAPFGLFVELIEHYVEGLVHISSMADDYYRFVEQQHIAARREHEEGLPAGRQGAGAGRARRHGAAAGRPGAGGDSRSGAARGAAARADQEQGEAEERERRRAQRPGTPGTAGDGRDAAQDRGDRATLGLLVGFAFLRRVLEVLDALADPATDLRQTVGPEDQDDDRQDDQKLRNAQAAHMSPRQLTVYTDAGQSGERQLYHAGPCGTGFERTCTRGCR